MSLLLKLPDNSGKGWVTVKISGKEKRGLNIFFSQCIDNEFSPFAKRIAGKNKCDFSLR